MTAARPLPIRPSNTRPGMYPPTVYQQPVVFLTVAEVAARLRVSRMTVYRLCERGDMNSTRIGRSIRIPQAALAPFLRQATEGDLK